MTCVRYDSNLRVAWLLHLSPPPLQSGEGEGEGGKGEGEEEEEEEEGEGEGRKGSKGTEEIGNLTFLCDCQEKQKRRRGRDGGREEMAYYSFGSRTRERRGGRGILGGGR